MTRKISSLAIVLFAVATALADPTDVGVNNFGSTQPPGWTTGPSFVLTNTMTTTCGVTNVTTNTCYFQWNGSTNMTDVTIVVTAASSVNLLKIGTPLFPMSTTSGNQIHLFGGSIPSGTYFYVFTQPGETFTVTPSLPEPGTLLLLGSALMGLAAYRRRRSDRF